MSALPQDLDAGFKVGSDQGRIGYLLVLPALPDLGQNTCYKVDDREFLVWLKVEVKENSLFRL